MIVKVCGMRDPDNIRAVEAAGIDWMGFIFWPGSKRYVAEPPTYMPRGNVQRVGVFVDTTIEDIVQHAKAFGLHLIQLHGSESPDFCREVHAATGRRIIKAFSIACTDDLARTKDYEGLADYFLFDTKSTLPGGSGQQFDWDILKSYDGSVPFLLSGGLGPTDLPRLRDFSHPKWIGIDLNSRFEKAPGIKDANLIYAFVYRRRNQPGWNRTSPFLP